MVEFVRLGMAIGAVYFFAANLSYGLLLVFSLLEIRKRKREMTHRKLEVGQSLHFSIIIPAFNEELVIVDAVLAWQEQFHSRIEIIVVDDGSTDSTSKALIHRFKMEVQSESKVTLFRSSLDSRISLIRKPRTGKSKALNLGIDYASHPFIVTADADSIPDRRALILIGAEFETNADLIGVSAPIRILNGARIQAHHVISGRLPKSPILIFQVIEYLRSFYCGRLGWQYLDSTILLSGAFAAFRRDALIAVGGFSSDTLAEDLDIVIRLCKRRATLGEGKIQLISEPICWTSAPTDFRTLCAQRMRWQRGLIETLLCHRSMCLNPRFGPVGLLSLPHNFFFEAIGPIAEVIFGIVVAAGCLLKIVSWTDLAWLSLVGFAYSLLLTIASICFEEYFFARQRLGVWGFSKLGCWALVEATLYRPLQWLWRFAATVFYPFTKPKWGTQAREKMVQGLP